MKKKKLYTIKEILEEQAKNRRVEDTPEYRESIKKSNKKIEEYQHEQAKMLIKASKYVSM